MNDDDLVTLAEFPAGTEPPWLAQTRLRMARRVLWLREQWREGHYRGEESLGIPHSEVDRALAPAAATKAAERAFWHRDKHAGELTRQIDELRASGPDRKWAQLCRLLDVTAADQPLLATTLATAAQPALRRVCGYLLDDTVGSDPSPVLVASLYDDPEPRVPGTNSALVRWALAEPVGATAPGRAETPWHADADVLAHLLPPAAGTDAPDEQPFAPVLHRDVVEDVARLLTSVTENAIHVVLVGPIGSGRSTIAAQVARAIGRPIRSYDAAAFRSASDPEIATIRAVRDARLAGALLVVRDVDELPEQSWSVLDRTNAILTTVAAPRARAGAAALRRSWRLQPPGRAARVDLWSSLVDGDPPPAVVEWRLWPGEIVAAARAAPAGPAAVRAVCRELLLASEPDLLSPLPASYRWDELVVPDATAAQLREVVEQARDRGEVLDGWGLTRLTPLGRGVTALFAGPSGVGKTMAAQVLARELDLDIFRVDLAGVVDKYIGETEKRLRQVFSACERAPVMLFFDEADALFGRRTQVSDAHDRYANIEIDYLLQQMEQFDGIALLATNRKSDLDPAFLRRLRFVVDFVPPTVDERERLWRLALEDAHDEHDRSLVGPLDWSMLASSLELTGAGIKSAALSAAFLARTDASTIEMRHVVAAARRELAKQGVVVRTTAGAGAR